MFVQAMWDYVNGIVLPRTGSDELNGDVDCNSGTGGPVSCVRTGGTASSCVRGAGIFAPGEPGEPGSDV